MIRTFDGLDTPEPGYIIFYLNKEKSMENSDVLASMLKDFQRENAKAHNHINTQNLSMCITFLGIESRDTVAIAITVMKDKQKKVAMDQYHFLMVMNTLETWLKDMSRLSDKHYGFPYFIPFGKSLPNWYKESGLNCHRVMFIPKEVMWNTIGYFFQKSHIRTMKSCKLTSVVVSVDTPEHEAKIKFY
jgi:hypothetical protein